MILLWTEKGQEGWWGALGGGVYSFMGLQGLQESLPSSLKNSTEGLASMLNLCLQLCCISCRHLLEFWLLYFLWSPLLMA